MNQTSSRIIAIAPASKGFGFAILEENEILIDWGVKVVRTADKNAEALNKIENLIKQYRPDCLVLEDVSAPGSRRSSRIRELNNQIVKLASARNVTVKLYSGAQVMQAFSVNGQGTKQTRAEILAQRFPEQLGSCLPAKRRAWESEDVRINIFEAVALALMFWVQRIKPVK